MSTQISANSRIDLRISNPEKEQWASFAKENGLTLTEMIKQSVRTTVTQSATVVTLVSEAGAYR